MCVHTAYYPVILNLLHSSHDEYGLGYTWNPSSLLIRVGDTVHWSWTGSAVTTRRGVAQVNSPGEMEYNGVGFRSRQSVTGSFSHTFTTPGTYYYITEGYAHIGMYCLIISCRNFKVKCPFQVSMAVSLFLTWQILQLSSLLELVLW